MSEKIEATWTIELHCDCPGCGEYVNLLDDPEFFVGRDIECGENRTDKSTDVEVYCPECGHEFKIDLVY